MPNQGQRSLGVTPFKQELPIGMISIEVRKQFYAPKVIQVSIKADRVEKLHIALDRGPGWKESTPSNEIIRRATGTLTIITDIDGASVWIDGTATTGKTPLTVEGVSAGTRKIALEYRGARAEKTSPFCRIGP